MPAAIKSYRPPGNALPGHGRGKTVAMIFIFHQETETKHPPYYCPEWHRSALSAFCNEWKGGGLSNELGCQSVRNGGGGNKKKMLHSVDVGEGFYT